MTWLTLFCFWLFLAWVDETADCHCKHAMVPQRQVTGKICFYHKSIQKSSNMFANISTHTFKVVHSLFNPDPLENKNIQIDINCITHTHCTAYSK